MAAAVPTTGTPTRPSSSPAAPAVLSVPMGKVSHDSGTPALSMPGTILCQWRRAAMPEKLLATMARTVTTTYAVVMGAVLRFAFTHPLDAVQYREHSIRMLNNMNTKINDRDSVEARRRRKRLAGAIKQSLRDLRMQLSLLNFRVGAHLDLKDVDLDCLDLVASHGPLSPSALARLAGLHPATTTGVLDRLERGGWIARERDPSDRRAVVVRAQHHRLGELMHLYAGM